MWRDAEKLLSEDEYIGPLIKKYGKCTLRPRKKGDYFEDLVDSIVQQQLSMKAAASIFNRIKEKISDEEDSKKAKKHRWRSDKTISVKVTPEKILKLSDKELRECGLSNAKVVYMKDLARKVSGGEVEIHKMDKLPDDKIVDKLISVKGIGKWTGDMFLMFTLARPDVFPVEDLGIRNAMKILLKKDMKPEMMVKFTQRWSPWRTVASWYLWKLLDS
jgi:DNA-3-methyladenine glycosylase II